MKPWYKDQLTWLYFAAFLFFIAVLLSGMSYETIRCLARAVC